jgi:hypothetical protein
MMKVKRLLLSVLFTAALGALSGCAIAPASNVERPAADVKVYTPGELSTNQYEVVSRIWVDSWRTAFRLPTYPSEDEAIASLRVEAARLGADGLVNVACSKQAVSMWSRSAEPAFLCYGNAIRVRRTAG